MKRSKIICVLLCAVLIATSLSFPVSATVRNDTEIMPLTEPACAWGNGIHQMRRRGVGSVFTESGDLLLYHKYCWQCDNCYTVIITSDDPTSDYGSVGYYCHGVAYEPVSMYGTQLYVATGTVLPYESSRHLSGHRFFYG